MASEHNKVMFKVRKNATKPQIKEAVEKLFDVKVKNVNTLIREGKLKMFKNKTRAAVRREARDRDPRRGSPHRRDHGIVREACDGIENIQSDHAEPAPAGDRRPFDRCTRARRSRR